MNERLKKLRKYLDLTQQEFADRIGIKRNTISTYEKGRNAPIDAVISLICREFKVNETWLRTGEGEMFIPTSSSPIDAIVQEYGLSEPSKILLERFIRLKPEFQDAVLDFMKDVVSALPDEKESSQPEIDIEAEVAEYRRQLELEVRRREKSGASENTDTKKEA